MFLLVLAAWVAVWDLCVGGRKAQLLLAVCLAFCFRAYCIFETPRNLHQLQQANTWKARLHEPSVKLEIQVISDAKVYENQVRVQAQTSQFDLRNGTIGKFEAIFTKPLQLKSGQSSEPAVAPPVLPELEQGQHWEVEGSVESVPGPRFPGDIDNETQMARQGITQRLRIRQWKKLSEPSGLLHLRHLLRNRLRKMLPPREAGLVIGVALGDASLLDPNLSQAFHRTSTTHLLAASGANVALLVWLVCFLGERMGYGPRPTALPCLCFGVVYTGLAGYASSIVRAAWMSLFSLWARHFGLQCGAGRSLAFAFLTCLLIAPSTLFDCGFQLSAGAVASLVWLQPQFEKIGPKILAPGVAVFWGLLPISLFTFQETNLGGILANLLIAPFVEVLLPAGLWLAVSQIGAKLVSIYGYWCVEAVLWISQFFSSMSMATPPLLLLVIWLGATFSLVVPRFAYLSLVWLPAMSFLCQPPPLGTGRICRVFQLYGKTVVWWQGEPNLVIAEDPKTCKFASSAVLRNHQPGKILAIGWTQAVPFKMHTLERISVDPHGIDLHYGRFGLAWGQQRQPSSLVVRKDSVYLPDSKLLWDLREHSLELWTDGQRLTLRPWIVPLSQNFTQMTLGRLAKLWHPLESTARISADRIDTEQPVRRGEHSLLAD